MSPEDLLPHDSPTAAGLPRARAAEHGLSVDGVNAFLDAVETSADVELHSLMILRHGQVLAEGWWAPYRPDDAVQLYSLSKSFTATAAGFAVAEGLLALDEPVLDVFPRFADLVTDERIRRLTISDCLRMATGHREDTLERVYTSDPDEPLRGFFALPLDAEPGSIFCYHNTATYLVATAVQERSGQTLTEYLAPRLFAPLGIDTPYWQTHPAGRQIGFAGLHLPTEAIASFGQLCLDSGRWQGRSVLPGGWVEQAARPLTDNSAEQNIDWAQGYGYQFWIARHGYRGDGAFGQFCLVLPEQDAVIAMTSQTKQMQTLLDFVWAHLLPALHGSTAADAKPADPADSADSNDTSETDVAERLSRLRLPLPGGAEGPDLVDLPTEWSVPTAGSSPYHPPIRLAELIMDSDSAAGTSGGPAGLIRLEHDVPGAPAGTPPISYSFRFDVDWHRETIDIGDRRLRYGAAAGWSGTAGSGAGPALVVEVAFLNSPHRLRVSADVTSATAEIRWLTTPLGPSFPIAVAVPNL